MSNLESSALFKGEPPKRLPETLHAFLDRFCAEPATLVEVLEHQPSRHITYEDGDVICRKGEIADAMWIILKGQVQVRDGSGFAFRSAGELIGELAFYRAARTQEGPRRGADIVAKGDVELYRIDVPLMKELAPEAAALWHQTVASVATAKIDDAQSRRLELARDRTRARGLLARFVCREGLAAAEASIHEDTPIDPERTNVLVWFSDIAGFSTHAQKLRPDEAGRLIHELMDIQIEAITDANGQIDKLMGDGLMAFWRLPHLNATARTVPAAVQAALMAADRVAVLVKERGLPIDIRIGLHSGPAIIGDFGGSDRIAFTLIGDTVNRASRYEQVKSCSEGRPLGRVRISPEIQAHIDPSTFERFEQAPRIFTDKHGQSYDVFSTTEEATQ